MQALTTCPSCSSTQTVLASVLTVIITALLAITIVALALIIIICIRGHPKCTLGVAETGTSAGGEEHVYEDMDDADEGYVAVCDPAYIFMEIVTSESNNLTLPVNETPLEGSTFQLQDNEAYAAHLYD